MPVTHEDLEIAVNALRRGELVAVPTETVYGLAADAQNPAAVAKIFQAKGRPADHPLIVHIPSSVDLGALATDVPELARTLVSHFWPGPLTLVLHKRPEVPDCVTAGLSTVGIRCPAEPSLQRLLEAFGGWVAAPSANRFKGVSPTTAEHVRSDLGDSVSVVLDGGPCGVGIESTIVDLTCHPPMVLRPGAISFDALKAVVGEGLVRRVDGQNATMSPGQLAAHYQPRARVIVAEDVDAALEREPEAAVLRVDGDIERFARRLYAAFRQADREGRKVIIVEQPPATGLGEALRDRLNRASAQ